MLNLTPAIVENVVLGQMQSLPSAYWPQDFVQEWKQQKGNRRKPTWTQFVQNLPTEMRPRAVQDWYRYQKSYRTPPPSQTQNQEVPQISEQEQPIEQQLPSESTQDFISRLQQGVTQFGRQFNQQTIRPYNNAIQHALKAIKQLSQQPDVSPAIREKGDQLLSLFQNIQASDAADAQLVQQLGQLAFELGQTAGAYNSGAMSDVQTRAPAEMPWARAASLTAGSTSASRFL